MEVIKGMTGKICIIITLLVVLAPGVGCEEESNSITTPDGRIIITDRTGKQWDITHAVKVYGMEAENWRFGLGPFAIRPINLPEMLDPGDPGYLSDESVQRVIGTLTGGEARAYAVTPLSTREVVNDTAGGVSFAAVY
jgi:hypothetical protein